MEVESDNTLTSAAIEHIGTPSATPDTVVPGDPVQKSGRTTGQTFGTVDAVGVTVTVGYSCCTRTMSDQITIDAAGGCANPPCVYIRGGDSGSSALNMSSPPQLIGLNFAGTGDGLFGVANKISNVLTALNLSLDLSACGVSKCPFTKAAAGTGEAESLIDLGHRFRDEVLAQTSRGQEYTRLYNQFSDEVVGLLVSNPGLLFETQEKLERYQPVLASMVNRGGTVVSQADLKDVDDLLRAYAVQASPGLRRVIEQVRRDLRDPQVQAEFGIRVGR